MESDGTIRDRQYMMIGKIEQDGTVRDRSYMMIGKVEADGTIRDRSYRFIGKAKDVPPTRAAIFYFFNLFQ